MKKNVSEWKIQNLLPIWDKNYIVQSVKFKRLRFFYAVGKMSKYKWNKHWKNGLQDIYVDIYDIASYYLYRKMKACCSLVCLNGMYSQRITKLLFSFGFVLFEYSHEWASSSH